MRIEFLKEIVYFVNGLIKLFIVNVLDIREKDIYNYVFDKDTLSKEKLKYINENLSNFKDRIDYFYELYNFLSERGNETKKKDNDDGLDLFLNNF